MNIVELNQKEIDFIFGGVEKEKKENAGLTAVGLGRKAAYYLIDNVLTYGGMSLCFYGVAYFFGPVGWLGVKFAFGLSGTIFIVKKTVDNLDYVSNAVEYLGDVLEQGQSDGE